MAISVYNMLEERGINIKATCWGKGKEEASEFLGFQMNYSILLKVTPGKHCRFSLKRSFLVNEATVTFMAPFSPSRRQNSKILTSDLSSAPLIYPILYIHFRQLGGN